MKILLLAILGLFTLADTPQGFEGRIVYKNSYKSKVPRASTATITKLLGVVHEYYIKGGDYKEIINGAGMEWQLYINKDNKLYSKIPGKDDITWRDAADRDDDVLKTEIKKDVVEVLGYKCDELTITCNYSVEKYYFNTAISADPLLFTHHKLGNWYDIISITKALPLKYILDGDDFLMEGIATEIKEMKLDSSFFQLPPGVKTTKSEQ